MQRKIFHISQDEKFIKLAKYQFNTLYGELNTYYIVVKNKVKPLNFVQKDNQTKVVERGELSLLSHEIPKNSIIVFHSIIPHFSHLKKPLRRAKVMPLYYQPLVGASCIG